MWCCGISRETWLVVAVLLAAFVAAVSVAMSILVNELEGSGGSPILFLGVILPLILVAVALGLLGAGWVAERRGYAVVLYPRGFAACMSHHCSPWLPRGSFSVGVDIMFSSAFVLWNVGGQVRASASVCHGATWQTNSPSRVQVFAAVFANNSSSPGKTAVAASSGIACVLTAVQGVLLWRAARRARDPSHAPAATPPPAPVYVLGACGRS